MSDGRDLDPMRRLLSGLLSQMRHGELAWSTVDLGSFALTGPDRTAVVISSRDHDDAFPFVLQLLNSEGVVIESLETGSEPDEDYGQEGPPYPWNADMAILYRAARSSALGIDETVDQFLASLEEPDEEPF